MYRYINTSGNWKNEKFCGNRIYDIAQRTLTEECQEISCVDIELHQLLANKRSEFTNAIL